MTIDYDTLAADVASGAFRDRLQQELELGFRQIQETGERLPTPSHYASQIAAIIDRNAATPLDSALAFEVYQEILEACERAAKSILSEAN